MRPAIKADRPSSAAKLNTFDPNTTPAPMLCCPRISAAVAEEISGPSAAIAAMSPRIASARPSRAATRSMFATSTALAPRLTRAPTRNTAQATPTSDAVTGHGCAAVVGGARLAFRLLPRTDSCRPVFPALLTKSLLIAPGVIRARPRPNDSACLWPLSGELPPQRDRPPNAAGRRRPSGTPRPSNGCRSPRCARARCADPGFLGAAARAPNGGSVRPRLGSVRFHPRPGVAVLRLSGG